MKKPTNILRREFCITGLKIGAGIAIGFSLPACQKQNSNDRDNDHDGFSPNAWIKIKKNNDIVFVISESEMGQGVVTSLSMLIAEELQVDLSKVKFEFAPLAPQYGFQYTGSSTTVRDNWVQLRKAGAVAREIMLAAAAQKWGIDQSQCYANNGTVYQTGSERSVTYGELCQAAEKIPLPTRVSLKSPEHFELIGTPVRSMDGPVKINGKAIFGVDVSLEGLLTATIAHSPVLGGKLKSFDNTKTMQVKGVRYVVPFESSIAVVAEHYWAAKKGLDVLDITWEDGPKKILNSHDINKQLEAKRDVTNAKLFYEQGNVDEVIHQAERIFEADYLSPMQNQAPAEPVNCTAYVNNNECDVWAPTQVPSAAQKVAAKHCRSGISEFIENIRYRLTGEFSLENIRIHRTFLGGGFGRRLIQDYVVEAVRISKAIGKPVKLIWSREEDMRSGYYRPMVYGYLKAAINQQGMPIAWDQLLVSTTEQKINPDKNPMDYVIPHIRLRNSSVPLDIPVGAWRSVAFSHLNFFKECFVDELAHQAELDPLEYRKRLLSQSPRQLNVLQHAGKIAKWGEVLAKGYGKGIAIHSSSKTVVCQIIKLFVDENKKIEVEKVVCVVDCGLIVNPDTVKAQMEGSIVYALTAALKGVITLEEGKVVQSNFHDYPLLRLDETPEMEIHLMKSREEPGGVGEPGVPPVAPALANAVFAATGKRIRKLPIKL